MQRIALRAISSVVGESLPVKGHLRFYDLNSHKNGTIWSIIDGISNNRSQFYQYDPLGRVTSGYQQDNAFNQTFSYDPWGNMTTSGTNNFNPLYDGNNRVSGAPANCTASNTYCYDAAGNMLNDAFHQYAFDGDNHVKSVDGTGATYTYDAGGERVRKDTGAKGTEYVYFQGTTIAEKDVSTGYWSDYIFFNGRRGLLAPIISNTNSISVDRFAGLAARRVTYSFFMILARCRGTLSRQETRYAGCNGKILEALEE